MQTSETTMAWFPAGERVWSAVAAVLLGGLLLATSGGTVLAQVGGYGDGKHGVFPPVPDQDPIPSDYAYLVWNIRTGHVAYCSTYTLGTGLDSCNAGSTINVEAQIPNIPAGGLTSGIYEFTDVALSTPFGIHRYVVVVGASPNAPLSVLSQSNISIVGNNGYTLSLYVKGWDGLTPLSQSPNLSVSGGRGGPGGLDGGASGNGGTTPGNGNAGFGPAGGMGGLGNSSTPAGLFGASAQAGLLNPSLTPLAGGSGGGGGAGVGPTPPTGCAVAPTGFAGGSGGGGGGALLLAASNQVTLGASATVFAQGGAGGNSFASFNSHCSLGGGGAGGSVRIVANDFTGSGTINLSGGLVFGSAGPAASGGFVRVEASFNTFNGAITGSAGGSFIGFPTAPVPINQPTLRITSINGASAPATPGASLAAPDITFPSGIETPVTLQVAASNVPLGTTVNIRVAPAVGAPSTTATNGLGGTVEASTAQATVTLPPGAGIVTATATFNVDGSPLALNALPTIDGERPQLVEVVALADGTSKTYLVARSGARFQVGQARP